MASTLVLSLSCLIIPILLTSGSSRKYETIKWFPHGIYNILSTYKFICDHNDEPYMRHKGKVVAWIIEGKVISKDYVGKKYYTNQDMSLTITSVNIHDSDKEYICPRLHNTYVSYIKTFPSKKPIHDITFHKTYEEFLHPTPFMARHFNPYFSGWEDLINITAKHGLSTFSDFMINFRGDYKLTTMETDCIWFDTYKIYKLPSRGWCENFDIDFVIRGGVFDANQKKEIIIENTDQEINYPCQVSNTFVYRDLIESEIIIQVFPRKDDNMITIQCEFSRRINGTKFVDEKKVLVNILQKDQKKLEPILTTLKNITILLSVSSVVAVMMISILYYIKNQRKKQNNPVFV